MRTNSSVAHPARILTVQGRGAAEFCKRPQRLRLWRNLNGCISKEVRSALPAQWRQGWGCGQ